MAHNKKNNDTKDDEITLKEASSKLDISESTVKKYLKDFDLEIIKSSGNKAVISQETFEALSEIAKLRANGLSIQEIKELKSQAPSKNILDEIEETKDTKKEEPPETAALETNGSLISGVSLEDEKDGQEKDITDGEIAEELDEAQEGVRRRHGFNYRYVERQISNDFKRVSSLRQRLRNPNLSVQERLFFEEALERRILFLNGWRHILRWISTK